MLKNTEPRLGGPRPGCGSGLMADSQGLQGKLDSRRGRNELHALWADSSKTDKLSSRNEQAEEYLKVLGVLGRKQV